MTPWPPSVAFPLTLIVSIAVLIGFDAAGAGYARRHPNVKYRNLWPVQFGLYVVVGFVAMLAVLDLRLAGEIGALTALAEATAGWRITWLIGPGRLSDATPIGIAIAIVSMIAFGYGLATAGGLLFNVVAAAVIRAHG